MMNFQFTNLNLTIENFHNSQWQEVINNSEKKDCFHYSKGFSKKLKETEQNNNVSPEHQITLLLLSRITYPKLKPESLDQPFATDVIEQIPDEYFIFLQDWVSHINDYELKARIADIIWIRKKNYRMAQLAIDNYLESAKSLEDPEHWTYSIDRIERAIRLAYQTNQKIQKQKVFEHIENVLQKYNGEDPLFLSAKLMEFLQEFKQGDPSIYAPLAEKLAKKAENKHNWSLARNYWCIAIGWYKKDKNINCERCASLNYAETYIQEAEDKINQSPPSYLVASRFLAKAIEALRNIGNNQKREEEIHLKLLDYQQKSTRELGLFSQEINLSNIAIQAINRVKRKKFDEAIYVLALDSKSPSKQDIKQQTKDLMENSLFYLFPSISINEMGKVIGINPSLEDEMCKIAVYHQNAQVYGIIEPMRNQINLEHYVKVSDFYSFVVDNPFIPRGREEIFARGLYSGLIGDFLVATHLLIPQIENSLRHVVKGMGKITSFLDTDKGGIQDEHIMSVLFDENKHLKDLEILYGEDIVFDLVCLLNRKGFGSNLRNNMAHGLLDINHFYTSSAVYFWWITLHLCCLHKISKNQSTDKNT
ncbi:DUF4209 domain-containing protein [Geminocystis sp. GBBB08]|uniref:DUF4209 domain-containing protein n=1 Tax=Geminocystis sp. GBBB08 TaxID=2604140 RepID=UPI0027E2D804|nr:DUF4209 domain-containing protein [Geminocystis sp. GBBB08]MBL1208253.1 DUF4209 domain-containing protein [Geminocystis sp. GBBB08]